ncbi:MAG: leucine-rich repeat-containing protein kinase family protein [Campylobacterota bacterium]|nr:leucine-rich repeat-containing protein kinase family protein [Campylobacterota bacterium]
MQTLEQLQSGSLDGIRELTISSGLISFPMEILDLHQTLETLDLSGNQLHQLPDNFGCLKKLRILFLGHNEFEEIPEVLSQCSSLMMIGLKSNRISCWSEDALPIDLRWLVLTDNQIEKIPNSIGKLHKLQKVMLAGNRVTTLPDTMRECHNLELIRLSANSIDRLPKWIFDMPRLSWIATAGNPCMGASNSDQNRLPKIPWRDITLHKVVGEGASGVISNATDKDGVSTAVKLFKGAVTSDGYPHDEMLACLRVGKHKNLNTPSGKIIEHPEEREALLFPLIPSVYSNLGNPPSFDSCTRDRYDDKVSYTLSYILHVVSDITSAVRHLHSRGVNHGDLYAHNILVNIEGESMLGDFGASSIYDLSDKEMRFEPLEVRAFGILLGELLDRSITTNHSQKKSLIALERLKTECIDEEVKSRPLFDEIDKRLKSIGDAL